MAKGAQTEMMASIAAHDGRSWAVFLSRAAALKALVTLALFVAFGVITSGAGSAHPGLSGSNVPDA